MEEVLPGMGRVLVIEGAHSMGGSFTSIEIVLRWGLRRGLQFDVMSAIDLRPYLPKEVGWFPMPAQTKYPISKLKFLRILGSQQFSLWRRFHKQDYDVIILNNSLYGNLPALLMGLWMKKPILQYVREFERDSRSWRLFHHKVDMFAAVSQAICDDMIQRLHVSPSHVLLALEGIETREPVTPEQRHFLRQMFGIPTDAQVIGFVGRLDGWKGYELFVDAAIRAAQRLPSLHAIMIGGAADGQERTVEAQKVKIANAHLHDRIRMIGAVHPDEVDAWLRTMDVFVHTSITPEPFGRVLLEAMAIGVPVLSSAEGGPREIVVDYQTGRLTPNKDVGALTDAIAWFFAEEGRTIRLGQASRQRALSVYSEAVCALPPLEWIRQQLHRG